jgi:hypothetical protein
MDSRKLPKQTKKDKAWQEKIVKQVKAEKVELGCPKGQELFEKVIKHGLKKKS